jgi:hypothetical protein
MTQDKQIFDLIAKEKERQMHGIELIASENFTSVTIEVTLLWDPSRISYNTPYSYILSTSL